MQCVMQRETRCNEKFDQLEELGKLEKRRTGETREIRETGGIREIGETRETRKIRETHGIEKLEKFASVVVLLAIFHHSRLHLRVCNRHYLREVFPETYSKLPTVALSFASVQSSILAPALSVSYTYTNAQI